MTIGQRIKAARKHAGITQRELGNRLGITYQTVAQWENDLRNPKIDTLKRIADALDITVAELTGLTQSWADYLTPDDIDAVNDALISYADIKDDHSLDVAARTDVFERYINTYSYAKRKGRLLEAFEKLNEKGQFEAEKRVTEMTFVPEYQPGYVNPDD